MSEMGIAERFTACNCHGCQRIRRDRAREVKQRVESKRADILAEIGAERLRQIAKWGDAGPKGGFGVTGGALDVLAADRAKTAHDAALVGGRCTMRHVLEEELAEVFAEAPGSAKQRAELVQVAAVAVKWIEAIDAQMGGAK